MGLCFINRVPRCLAPGLHVCQGREKRGRLVSILALSSLCPTVCQWLTFSQGKHASPFSHLTLLHTLVGNSKAVCVSLQVVKSKVWPPLQSVDESVGNSPYYLLFSVSLCWRWMGSHLPVSLNSFADIYWWLLLMIDSLQLIID